MEQGSSQQLFQLLLNSGLLNFARGYPIVCYWL